MHFAEYITSNILLINSLQDGFSFQINVVSVVINSLQ